MLRGADTRHAGAGADSGSGDGERTRAGNTQDRVKALVRVPVGMRAQLAVRLRSAVARHMASRTPGELRFQIDPKDLI